MTTARDSRSFRQRFLEVKCPCGRMLRAPVESAGSTIQCWSCKAAVPVPVPRDRRLAGRVLLRGMRDVFNTRTLAAVAVGGVLLTFLLLLPIPGPARALLVLGVAGLGYGEVIRRGELSSMRTAGKVVRGVVTVPLAALGMVPWLFVKDGEGLVRPPVLTATGLAVAAVLAFVVPVVLVLVWAPRPRAALVSLVRHPVATVAAIAMLPVGLALVELVAVGMTSWLAFLSFYVMDLYPHGDHIHARFGISHGGNYTSIYVVDSNHLRLYAHYLTHGIPLAVALPASLGASHDINMTPWSMDQSSVGYLAVRMAHTAVILAAALFALALQGHCLALLARLGTLVVAAKPPPQVTVSGALPEPASPAP